MAIYRKLNRESRIRRSILAGLTKDVEKHLLSFIMIVKLLINYSMN